MEVAVDWTERWFLLPSVKLLLSLHMFFHSNPVSDHHPQSILGSSDIVGMSQTYMEMNTKIHDFLFGKFGKIQDRWVPDGINGYNLLFIGFILLQ